jgi:tetratricopeptide (TPR) repeat protein
MNEGAGKPPSVPDYELLRRVGAGAYGEIWLARSTATGVFRAVKIVWRRHFHDDRPFEREFDGIQRFERISRAHVSQLALFHIGRSDAAGYFYYVMELADDARMQGANGASESRSDGPTSGWQASGPPALKDPELYAPHTLRADLTQGRLPATQVLEIGLALSEALGHLHGHGLIHRDVKPSNVIFVNGRPKLADIGLVTDASDQCSIVGTEGYLPPEGTGTPQADIFALGKVLYEAATGLDRRDLPKLPEDIRSWPDASLVFELNEVMLKACAADARQRYQSAEELRGELALLQRGQSVRQRRRWQQRIPVLRRIGLAAVAVSLVAGGAAFFWQMRERNDPPLPGVVPPEVLSGTHNPNAAQAYTSGRIAMGRGTPKGFRQAQMNFTAATMADPRFVAAYARLFETYLMDEDYDLHAMPADKTEQLTNLTAILMKQSPTNAETHAALAIVRFLNEWNWSAAEQEFKQALQSDPNCRMALTYYGYFLTRQRRAGEARKVLERAQKMEPDSPLIAKFLGHCEYVQRRYEEALRFYQRASERDENYPSSHYWAGRANLALTNYEAALVEFEEHEARQDLPARHQQYQALHAAFQKEGQRGIWLKNLEAFGDEKTQLPYWYAECHARLGDRAKALDGLEEAVKQRDTVHDLLVDEFWDDYRNEPRFKECLKKVGLDSWAR